MNIESVIAKTDLFDLVRKAGGDPDTRTGRCSCPLHGGSDTNAFHVYTDAGKQYWKCFSGDCGGGDAIDFVRVWRGWEFKQAYEFLGGDVQSDPSEMKRLADVRHEKALAELLDKQNRMDAARKELQVAERHLLYHDSMGQWARDLWNDRGIDEGMQDFWKLGACEDFVINGDYHTPTLSIPIFDTDMNLLNIKHRLIKPPKPNDKYRPERSGLGAFPPFLALPSMGYDGDLIIVMEGEIKAMVTWTRVSGIDVQCIGVPGRSQFRSMADKIGGKNVLVIPDPGAEKDAFDFARQVKGKYLPMPEKIDDYILANDMNSNDLFALLKQARKT
jgi:hypothetical protein